MELARFAQGTCDPDYWASRYSLLTLLPSPLVNAVFACSTIHRLAASSLPADGPILDAGCGFGVLSVIAGDAARRITGIDSSPSLVGSARRHAPLSRFLTGELTALPFADASFAMVVAISSFELVREGLPLAESFRVLRPGGRLLIASPRRPRTSWPSRKRRISSTMGPLTIEKVAGPVFPFPPDGYGYYYSGGELLRAVRRAGFREATVLRSDLLGGLAHSAIARKAAGRWLRAELEGLMANAEAANAGCTGRLLRRALERELRAPAAPGIAMYMLLRIWSYWNVIRAIR